MKKNKFYSVIVNAIIAHEGKILIAQRDFKDDHMPGMWSIPGGKVENIKDEEFSIIEKTLVKEIREEVGIEINNNIVLIANNTFKHTKGYIVLALVFLCQYKSGEARPLEDTIDIAWIDPNDIDDYTYPDNVRNNISKGFALLPFMKRKQNKE
jgi:mutator protein MutT